MDSCMVKYNHLGYLTILYSIRIPSLSQLVDQKMLCWPSKISCAKICFQIHLYKNTPPILKCVLFSSIVEEILAKTNTSERPSPNMDVEPFIQKISLFFYMHFIIPHNFDDAFEIGELTVCNNDNPVKIKKILV